MSRLDSHTKRWITGVALAGPLVAMLAWGPLWLWTVAVTGAACVGLWEYEGIAHEKGLPPMWRAFSLGMGVVYPLATFLFGSTGLLAATVGSVFFLFLGLLTEAPLHRETFVRAATTFLGWLYVPFLLSFVLLLGALEHDGVWVFYTMVVIVAGDVGAFYTGKKWGRHKLWKTVSPKKTVEGAMGGLAASVCAGTAFAVLFLRDVGGSLGGYLLLSALVEAAGQLGDLMESLLKRMADRKDSSNLLPGHGGLLDRLDSLLFAFPMVWFFAGRFYH